MRKIGFILFIALFIASCAPQPVLKKAPDEKEALAERATLYWEAKKKNDWDAVKEFVDPEIRGEIIPYLDSMKNKPNMSEIVSFNIESLNLADGTATVSAKIAIRVTHPLLGSPRVFEQTIKDRWIKRGNDWYIIIVKPDLRKLLEELSKKNEKKGLTN